MKTKRKYRFYNVFDTEMYCKLMNTHDYLPYDSTHPNHIKNNIPYNLAKGITVFVSNHGKVIIRLDELSFYKNVNNQNME